MRSRAIDGVRDLDAESERENDEGGEKSVQLSAQTKKGRSDELGEGRSGKVVFELRCSEARW